MEAETQARVQLSIARVCRRGTFIECGGLMLTLLVWLL